MKSNNFSYTYIVAKPKFHKNPNKFPNIASQRLATDL